LGTGLPSNKTVRKVLEQSVGNFETEKASNFNKLQQLSTSSLQAVQHQTVTILKIQQVSIMVGIWFGTIRIARAHGRWTAGLSGYQGLIAVMVE
jgi:hypothetical protein